jgi:hypothetical protein
MSSIALSFDRHQFAGWQPSHFVKDMTDAGLAREDRENIHTERHATRLRKWIPEWAASDEKLRAVLSARIQCHATHFRSYLRRGLSGSELAILVRHKAAIKRAGSYEALHAAIAYRSFRLGWHSSAVAESLGVTAAMVRMNLMRMRDTARRLGFEENEPQHWSRGVKHGPRKKGIRLQRGPWAKKKYSAQWAVKKTASPSSGLTAAVIRYSARGM